jgi:hypothetical protein
LLLTINRGNSWGWTSPATLVAGASGIAALLWFYQVEKRASAPLIPVKWLRTRNVAFPVVTQGLMNMAYMGSFLLLPQMLENGLGYTPGHIGWLVISRPLVFSLIAPAAGFIVGRMGERNTGMTGAFAILLAMILMYNIDIGTTDWVIILSLGLTGFGMALIEMLTQPCHLALDRAVSLEAQRNPSLGRRFFEAGPGHVRQMLTDLLAKEQAEGRIVLDDPAYAAKDLLALWLGFNAMEQRFCGGCLPDEAALRTHVARAVRLFLKANARDQ